MEVKFCVLGNPMDEEWRIIEGTDEIYAVSNYGRVKSKDITQRRSNGKTMCNFHIKGRILKAGKVCRGRNYYAVVINGKTRKVHRLVAEAFVPNPYNLPVVNHKDGNTMNNKADNLEWTTIQGNNKHAWENGLMKYGENVKNARLLEKEVEEIRKTYKKGDSQFGAKPLARKYGVSDTTIRNIIKGKKWRRIEHDS